MNINAYTERARLAAQGEAVGEEVENFVFLHLSPYSHHERQAQKATGFAGCQGVLGPLVRFLGSFFLERERMNIAVCTARRAAVRASVGEAVKIRFSFPAHFCLHFSSYLLTKSS